MRVHNTKNTCPICLTEDLDWHVDISKSDMQLFKCGHGTCKACYVKLLTSIEERFSCPLCRGGRQPYYTGFLAGKTGTEKWTTFAEWYNDYEIYIDAGLANNICKNSAFGKQLLRLHRELRRNIIL